MLPRSPTESKLDAEIISSLEKLEQLDPKSEEYTKIVESVTKLHKLKTEEVDQTTKLHKLESESRFSFKQVSPDTILVVAANIFSILWLARYERENVIKSRAALGFVRQPR